MLKKRIAVLVSGGGTNLQALINAVDNNIITSGEIAIVISNRPGVMALARASQAGIKNVVVDKSKLGNKFEDELLKTLAAENIDLIVLAGFLSILSPYFISQYRDRIINVHPSLIPSFCGKGFYGLRVHQAALDYGVKVTGATVHFVNEVPDGGKIIMQRAVYIQPTDDAKTLQKRVMEQAEWIILPQAVEYVLRGLKEDKNERHI
jgi:phosphoribosylglycinamide formyltransferase